MRDRKRKKKQKMHMLFNIFIFNIILNSNGIGHEIISDNIFC